jgi:hypothetical protein
MADQCELHRRTLLADSLALAGLLGTVTEASFAATRLEIETVTRLYPVEVARIVVPRSTAEVAAAVTSWPGQVAVGGGRYSMGGRSRFAAACIWTCVR